VRHHRSDAYSAEQVLLNKRQIYGGAPKLHWYPETYHKSENRNRHSTNPNPTTANSCSMEQLHALVRESLL